MIAVTQARGSHYIAKAEARGKTRTEAQRLLRRQLSNTVQTALLADEKRTAGPGRQPLPHAA